MGSTPTLFRHVPEVLDETVRLLLDTLELAARRSAEAEIDVRATIAESVATAQSEEITTEFVVSQTGQFFRIRQVP